MAEERRLQPLIQQAYGQPVQGVNTSGIQDYFGKEVERKRGEYKSAQEIGLDLGAKYYGKLEGDVNNIMGEVKAGNLQVGTPEWYRQVGSLKAKAGQIKQVQDLNEQNLELLDSNPDQSVFYFENEQGERVAGTRADLIRKQEELLNKDYDSVYELVNQNAQMLEGVKMMRQGFTQGYRNLRTDAQNLSTKLLSGTSAERSVQIDYPGLGAYTITTTSEVPDEVIQQEITTFVDQYGDFLTDDYYVKKRNGQTTSATPEEYVKEVVERMFVPTGVSVERGRMGYNSRRGGGGTGTVRLEDVTKAARSASDTLDVAPLNEFLKASEREAQYNPTDNQFIFYSLDKTASGATTQRDIVRIDADDPEALARYLYKRNEKEIDVGESLDTFQVPPSDKDVAAKAREEAQAPIKAAENLADKALNVSTSDERDSVEQELNRLGVTDINFAGTMLSRKNGIESVKIPNKEGGTKELNLTTVEGKEEFKKYLIKQRDNITVGNKKTGKLDPK